MIHANPEKLNHMIATLIGGTGLTGSLLLQQLLADPSITQIISIARRPLEIQHAKLTEVWISDLTDLPRIESQIRGDLYFCCLGTTRKAAGNKENYARIDHDAVLAFASIAKAHNAKSFTLVSAMGANARSMFFYSQIKGRTEDDIAALRMRSLLIFRPALLVGPRREPYMTDRIAARTLVPLSRLMPTRTSKSLITEVKTLATRMLTEAKLAPIGIHIIRAKDI